MAARANNVLWLAEISKFLFSETDVLTEPKFKLYMNDHWKVLYQVTGFFYVNLKSKMAAYAYEPILCHEWSLNGLLLEERVRWAIVTIERPSVR